MRRRYYNSDGQKKIRMEALLTMQKARREIDPVLLEKAQKAIADAWFARKESGEAEVQGQDNAASGTVAVDMKRNLCVIQKFIEMNPDNREMQQQIKMMIAEHL